MRILLTGATGFLGSHIAESLLTDKYEILALKRTISKYDNLSFTHSVLWVDIDTLGWEKRVVEFSPSIIIHTAWIGVSSEGRDNWNDQLENIDFMTQLLELARLCGNCKFISLGSQAEYGNFSGKIDETYPVNPTNAYGFVKVSAQRMLQSFCEIHNICWYWLRVFSVFGERESDKWLIPNVIKAILQGEEKIDCTFGQQRYSYLYVKDFAEAVKKIVKSDGNYSGIYNISSNHPIKLRTLLEMIKEKTNPNFQLNYGALPYRSGQSMHMEGDASKFQSQFGDIVLSDFENKLEKTINYYKEQNHETI